MSSNQNDGEIAGEWFGVRCAQDRLTLLGLLFDELRDHATSESR